MFKFLTISKCLQLNCSQIQRLLVIVSLFWICPAFSHFTFHISREVLYHNWSKLKAVNNILTSYVKFGPIKVAHLQNLANQAMTNGALVIEMVNNSTLVVQWSEERSNRKQNTRFSYISKLFRVCKRKSLCLDQVSANTKFILNLLQKHCMETSFW